MIIKYTIFLYYFLVMSGSESARILIVIPTPSLSHQVVFRPLIQELAKTHKVVVITTDPAFTISSRPANLTEVDVHDASYSYFRKHFKTIKMGTRSDSLNVFSMSYKYMIEVLGIQLQQIQVKELFKETFDLLMIESWFRPFLVFSTFWQVPVIKISSFYPLYNDFSNIGSFEHPILYPYSTRQKIFNLSWWDEMCELQNDYNYMNVLNIYEKSENDMIRKNLGAEVPLVSELNRNVDMLYANVLLNWGSNRPVPPSVIYIGGIHQNVHKPLPKDLQSYLDASVNGVVYVSFGTHVVPSLLPADRIQVLIKVLSRLPYDVLFRWNLDHMPGKPKNVRIAKWFPQTDVLRHPKIKLFITQGGLQSTEEGIRSSVPLLGLPMFMDQWYNTEKYAHHGIGLKLEFESLTEEQLTDAINKIVKDNRYRENLISLRTMIDDQPISSLDRAVWWTGHMLRHGGRHLLAPAANMGWLEYFELELLAAFLFALVVTLALLTGLLYFLAKLVWKLFTKKRKIE